MTLENLRSEAAALGFETSFDKDEVFIPAVNRALRDLYSRRKILRSIRIFSAGREPSYYQKEITCQGGTGITLPLMGRAFSMRLCGMGNYKIVDGDETKIIQFNTGYESRLVNGFITIGGTIRFYGAVSFTVYDFSVYDEIYSVNADDIPDGAAIKSFDIRGLYEDFMSFEGPATDAWGNIIEGATLIDGRLEISSSFKGEIRLSYRRLPTSVYVGQVDDIDVPEEYSHLLPLLVAFYIWLDVDQIKAFYYLEQYEKMLDLMSRSGYEQLDFSYHDTNGWA